jgi:hypothetical protein
MDTNDLIKNVIQENVVETKKLAHELLMQKLSERLQQKFDEYAPNTFLDEETVEESDEDSTEELDENLYRNELTSLLEKKKHKKEEEEEEEEEGEEEEEMGEDGLVYEDGEDEEDEEMGEDGLVYEDEGCENCDENDAEEMNKKAFGMSGISEELKGKQHKLDVAEPKGKLTAADFKKLRNKKK